MSETTEAKTPPPGILLFAQQLIHAFTEAQVIAATKPSESKRGGLAILWYGDAAERLSVAVQRLLEARIRAACQDANVLEEMVAMLAVGNELHHDAPTIMSRALGAAMLLAFGIHPTYGDAMELAIANAGDLLSDAQRRTMSDLEHRGYVAQNLIRYARMKKEGHLVHIAPDGSFASADPAGNA